MVASTRSPSLTPYCAPTRRASDVKSPIGAVPAHDLGVGLLGLEAAPEHLVAGAAMGGDRAAQADLDLLEVGRRLVPAEDPGLHGLVPAPRPGEHRGGVVVVAHRHGGLGRVGGQVALLGALFGHAHARHGPEGHPAAGDDVAPVDGVAFARSATGRPRRWGPRRAGTGCDTNGPAGPCGPGYRRVELSWCRLTSWLVPDWTIATLGLDQHGVTPRRRPVPSS